MSFNAKQLITEIIRPSLTECSIWSGGAEQLLAGTCAVESCFGTFLRQIKGPALGPFQMEPDTHDDLWRNYLKYNKVLANQILKCSHLASNTKSAECMISNLIYAALMARVRYYVIKEPIPLKGDIVGHANYWKKYYNTAYGAGTPQKYLESWNTYVKLYYS